MAESKCIKEEIVGRKGDDQHDVAEFNEDNDQTFTLDNDQRINQKRRSGHELIPRTSHHDHAGSSVSNTHIEGTSILRATNERLLLNVKLLTVDVVLQGTNVAIGTLLLPVIWNTFIRRYSLKSENDRHIDSAPLLIKLNIPQYDLSKEDTMQATVTFSFYVGRSLYTRHVFGCKKAITAHPEITMIVCPKIPIEICQCLERAYNEICGFINDTSKHQFIVIGRNEQGEKIMFLGKLKKDVFNKILESESFVTADEDAAEFFQRTFQMSYEEWTAFKVKNYPDIELTLVIKLWVVCPVTSQ